MLRERVATALVAIPLLIVVLALGRWWIAGLVLLLAILASLELFALLRLAGYASLTSLGIALGLGLVADGIFFGEAGGAGLLLVAAGLVLVSVGSFARTEPRDAFATWLTTVFGGLYVGLLGFLPRIIALDPGLAPDAPLGAFLDGGRWWLALTVLAVWAYDTGAYAAGRTFGGPRFLTAVSPSKTWAGLYGGLFAVGVVSAIILWGLGRSPLEALLIGPLIGLAAQAGDLAESVLKRIAGVKDSGRLFPGHGGLLDRLDSLLFAGPAVYFYVVAFVH